MVAGKFQLKMEISGHVDEENAAAAAEAAAADAKKHPRKSLSRKGRMASVASADAALNLAPVALGELSLDRIVVDRALAEAKGARGSAGGVVSVPGPFAHLVRRVGLGADAVRREMVRLGPGVDFDLDDGPRVPGANQQMGAASNQPVKPAKVRVAEGAAEAATEAFEGDDAFGGGSALGGDDGEWSTAPALPLGGSNAGEGLNAGEGNDGGEGAELEVSNGESGSNHDGALSRKKTAALTELFAHADENSDGERS